MKHLDWNKVLANLAHAALIFGSAYVVWNPEYAWLAPAMQALGGGLPGMNFTPRERP